MEEVVKAHPAFPFFVAMACDGESPVFFLKNIRTPITIKVPVKNGGKSGISYKQILEIVFFLNIKIVR
jgi:hypothetical protein